MRVKYLLIFIILFNLYGCKPQSSKISEKNILGDWIFVKSIDIRKPGTYTGMEPPPPPAPPSFRANYKSGFTFFTNGICDKKLGYFKRIGNARRDRVTNFIGTKTKFRIEGDSLRILDLATNKWVSTKLVSIVGDTLTLQTDDSIYSQYAKNRYNLNPKETYDKIIVSSSGCYGSCPIMDISIADNGQIFYLGKEYNTQNGLFTSTISKEEFRRIETDFKKSDILHLKNDYSAGWTDDETVTITFIRNNQIVKTISDYGGQSPTELLWAYTPVRFLYQKLKLAPFSPIKPQLPDWWQGFETKDQICDLPKSERFLLLTEMFKSKEVKQQFEPKYTINFWGAEDKMEKIYTDGRYFKFPVKSGDFILDLGYNFLSRNSLSAKFRKKNEYEYD